MSNIEQRRYQDEEIFFNIEDKGEYEYYKFRKMRDKGV